jgi:hypothetical protein
MAVAKRIPDTVLMEAARAKVEARAKAKVEAKVEAKAKVEARAKVEEKDRKLDTVRRAVLQAKGVAPATVAMAPAKEAKVTFKHKQ